ncbi:CDP-glycerol glycerophosphotransferase family protein [Halobacillus sp. B23F22_1]|uniref:CDP-glycerol glycerophosphotransferase family protein n=1 Tax=Halobacillus sp. B23F22_1 TaxID=3459514 RepID=UPI00373E49F5
MKRIKSFFHKIKEEISSEESDINTMDIKIKDVQFDRNLVLLTLSERVTIKKAQAKIVIKDMKNSEEISEVGIIDENRAKINLKDHYLLDYDKCAFYLRINEEETRLKPLTSLSSNLKDYSHTHELEDYLLVPYTTIKGNFSIKVIERFTLNHTKDLPHGLLDIQYHTKQPIIKGWLFADNETKLNCKIIMKKRGSNLIYQLPTTVLKNEWQAVVDLPSFQPSKGTWDYYLKVNEKKNYRILIEDNNITEHIEAQTYQTNRESRWNTFYMTKNGALSSKIKSATVQMLDVQAKVVDNYTVKCSGTLDGVVLDKNHKIDQAKVVVEQRNTGKSHLSSIDLSIDENSTLRFNFLLNYLEIISQDGGEYRWDVYLRIPYHEDKAVYRFKLDAEALAYQSRIELGKEKINQVYMYPTVNKQLSIVIKDLSIERNVESFKFSNHELNLSGHAYLDTVEWISEKEVVRNLILRERETEQESVLPLEGKYNNLEKFGYRYHFSGFDVQINLGSLLSLSKERKKIFDLYVQFNYKGITKERRLGCEEFTYYKDDVLDRVVISREDNYEINYLTYTPSGNLKIETNCIPSEALSYLSYESNGSSEECLDDIWLIGERSNTAQDTGYHFFKFCRENYPEKQVYYAIDSHAEDRTRIESLGNVVNIGSIEHYKIASSATAFIGSHDLEYFLPAKGIEFNSYKQGKKVFLQHGVLGRKNVEYHKDYYKYPFDLFCVSSWPEKNLVEKKLGYNKDEVEITGLTRFDSLLNNNNISKKSILFIPTWRDWLLNENDFLESEYYKRYKGMLQNERLHEVLKENNVELNFFPHYRMQPFVDHFEINNDNINVLKLGDKAVQELLLENNLMITDYSSVSFDFNYMSKPVVFYHFDRDSFFRKGILRPVEETFLGDICYSEDELVNQIAVYIKNDFTEKEEVATKKHLIFSEIDKNNCQRVYNRILEI